MQSKIKIVQGDITKIAVDAIVNAANTSLLGGGGVDGAIHRAGGHVITDECQRVRNRQGGCKIGNSVITIAGNLPAKYVIHTVGPYWSGGNHNEIELLRQAYCSTFELIDNYNIRTISLPNISTGIYKFPKELAASIALEVIDKYLRKNTSIELINLVCLEEDNFHIYTKKVHDIFHGSK